MTDEIGRVDPNESGTHTDPEAGLTRRGFLAGVAVLAVAGVLGLDRYLNQGGSEGGVDVLEEPDNEIPTFSPEIHVRDRAQAPECCGGQQTEVELSDAQKLRLGAPVFTLVHTIEEGQTVTSLLERYFDPELVENGIAEQSLFAANPSLSENPNIIQIGDEVTIPVSEPAFAEREADETLAEVAERFGFSESAVRQVNDGARLATLGDLQDRYVYLPVQANPSLHNGERLLVVESNPDPDSMTTYFSTATQKELDLSNMIGRNRPAVTHLELGHVLIVRSVDDSTTDQTVDTTPDTTAPETTTTTTIENPSPPTTPELPDTPENPSIEQLKARRSWSERIDEDDRTITLEDQQLEEQITVELVRGIELTREKYEAFREGIDTRFRNVFEEAEVLPDGIIENPQFHLWHHTAAGYPAGDEGIGVFTQGLIDQALSVQWVIDQDARGHLLVDNPNQIASHAAPRNTVSSGHETMTPESKAQGDIDPAQLEAGMYLSYYILTEVNGYSVDQIDGFIRGHREVNDEFGDGTPGKPDFDELSMNAIRAKIKEFAQSF